MSAPSCRYQNVMLHVHVAVVVIRLQVQHLEIGAIYYIFSRNAARFSKVVWMLDELIHLRRLARNLDYQ